MIHTIAAIYVIVTSPQITKFPMTGNVHRQILGEGPTLSCNKES